MSHLDEGLSSVCVCCGESSEAGPSSPSWGSSSHSASHLSSSNSSVIWRQTCKGQKRLTTKNDPIIGMKKDVKTLIIMGLKAQLLHMDFSRANLFWRGFVWVFFNDKQVNHIFSALLFSFLTCMTKVKIHRAG